MLTIIIELLLLVFAVLVIELIIVYRKAKQLQRSVIECKSKVDEQSVQIAEKDAEIEELDKLVNEPSFYAYDVRAILDTVYLECYNNHTKQSFTKYLGAVTNERQRKEMVTRLHKLVKGQYHISTQG